MVETWAALYHLGLRGISADQAVRAELLVALWFRALCKNTYIYIYMYILSLLPIYVYM